MEDNKNESLLKKYMRDAAATISSLLVYSLYSIVDGIFISRGVNEYAMSAVNLVLPYTNVLFSVGVVFAIGSGTVLAVFMGEGKTREANRLFSQNAAVITAIGALLAVAVLVFRREFVAFLGAESETETYAIQYITGLAPFSLFFMLSYNLEVLIKTDGYPKMATVAVTSGCLCNCLLDYIAVFVLDMGVLGAAVATGLSQLIVCIIYLYHFIFGKSTFRFVPFGFDLSLLRRTVPLGIADGVTEVCGGILTFIFNHVILNSLGADGLVCYTVVAYINTLVLNVLWGVSSAAQPLVSYNHGAKCGEKCRRLFYYTVTAELITSAVIIAGLQLGANPISSIFIGDNGTLVVQSAAAIRKYCLGYVFSGVNIAIVGYLTAREKAKAAMVISGCRGFVLPTVMIFALASVGGAAVWYVPICAETVSFAIEIAVILKMRQMQKQA